jgi:hypothetical protein
MHIINHLIITTTATHNPVLTDRIFQTQTAKNDTDKYERKPVAKYAFETWTLTEADERALGLFERTILRSIFGAVQDKGQWRRKYKSELYKLHDEPDLAKYIKINRLKWAGHVEWIITGQLRECLTPDQKEKEGLEDLN